MEKKITIEAALDMIPDGATVAVSGAMLAATPRELYVGIGKRFLESGHPRGLTVMHAAGNGNNKDEGIIDMTHEGLIARYICGHLANNTKMVELINQNKVQAYNLPLGVIAHMYRAAAMGKAGEITRIGLHTFCDPRLQGGKLNDVTTEDLVELITLDGEEQLMYRTPKLDIGLIRGTTADELGNITMEEELSEVDALDVAMAVKAMGGKVIVQVKNYVSSRSIDRNQVVIPGCMVDAVVVSQDPIANHRQTPGSFYNPVLAGHYRLDGVGFATLPLSDRKVIARRAAMELPSHAVVNLGIGMPEGVAAVAKEEGLGDNLVLTVETGLIGGTPSGGQDFGAAINAWASLPVGTQFDYYHGGNLDLTCLGFAEIDAVGNVNVGRFGTKIPGCGGFVDISQSTKHIVFCGTMTAGGLKVAFEDNKIKILQEGSKITFSSEFSKRYQQNVLFVTERCVFQLIDQQLVLTEVAPGIEIERDILPHMDFQPVISEHLKTMDPRIFGESCIDLKSIIGA